MNNHDSCPCLCHQEWAFGCGYCKDFHGIPAEAENMEEKIESVLRKQFGDYEKDYYIDGGSLYFANLFRRLIEEVIATTQS